MATEGVWKVDGNRNFDSVTTAVLVMQSFIFSTVSLLLGVVTGTNGATGAPAAGQLCTCAGSSDAATAGMDGVNRLGLTFNAAKIVRAAAGVAHTWVVVQMPAAAGSYQVCFDWGTASNALLAVVASKAGFTGGTTLNRPTATDEVGPLTLTIADVSLVTHRASRVVDADGNWHLLFSRAGAGYFHTIFGLHNLRDIRTGDTYAGCLFGESVASGRGVGRATTSAPFVNSAATGGLWVRGPSGQAMDVGAQCGIMGNGAHLALTIPNPADSKGDANAVWLWFRYSSSAAAGVKGRLRDWWLTNEWKPVGDTAPDTGDPELVQTANLLLPNGGLTLLV